MKPFFVILPIGAVSGAGAIVSGASDANGRHIVAVDGDVALAIFTEQDLAEQFARNFKCPKFQLGWFDDPIDFACFLQVQQRQGCTHVCIDAKGIGEPAVMLSIEKTLVSISQAIMASA